LFLSLGIFSQCPKDTTGYQVIMDLTICHTTVQTTVEYDENCPCYYYTYTITSPQENKGKIRRIASLFKTSKKYKTVDETLPFNSQCDFPIAKIKERSKNMEYDLIPYSVLSCPEGWESGPHTGFSSPEKEKFILPSQTVVFKIASHFPPGKRQLKFIPDTYELLQLWFSQYAPPPDREDYDPGYANPPVALEDFFTYVADVVGPVDPEELDLYNGGGQKPDDVNLFLRYGNPKESQTELPAGTNTFEVFIYYGKTIKKETFKATLNSQDIKNLFHPTPGGGDWVKINLQSGRNVLEFSIDGARQDGRVANDKDRLVLIVK